MPADPLEALRQPVVPIAPRQDFAAALRARVADALGLTASPSAPSGAACGRRGSAPALSVYLCVRGAPAAIDFYREVFGAVETMRMTGDDGRVGHAEITVEGMTLMLVRRAPGDRRRQPRDARRDAGQPLPARRRRRRHLRPGGGRRRHRRAAARRPVPRQPQRLPARPLRPSVDAHPAGRGGLRRGDGPARAGLHRHCGGRSRRPPGSCRPRPASSGTSPCRRRTSGGPPRSTPRCSAGTSSRRGRAAPAATYSHVDNTSMPFGIHDAMDDPSPHHYYRVEDLQAMMVRVRELGGEVALGRRVRVRRQRPLPGRPGRRVRPVAGRARLLTAPGSGGLSRPGRAAGAGCSPRPGRCGSGAGRPCRSCGGGSSRRSRARWRCRRTCSPRRARGSAPGSRTRRALSSR